MARHFGRRRFRGGTNPRMIIKSYKKVLNFAGTTRAAAALVSKVLIVGVDSTAIGQTGPVDGNVPTGSIVKVINCEINFANLTNVSAEVHLNIQLQHSGQSVVDPRVVGGNPQRNQVFYQKLFPCLFHQNTRWAKAFKIPPKFQRVREGDFWSVTHISNQINTDIGQFIYKVYS